jgi:hypothetical protein
MFVKSLDQSGLTRLLYTTSSANLLFVGICFASLVLLSVTSASASRHLSTKSSKHSTARKDKSERLQSDASKRRTSEASFEDKNSNTPTAQGTADANWEFSVTPYFFLPRLTGTVGVLGQRAEVNASFLDLFRNLDLALMGTFEARKGNWSFMPMECTCRCPARR